MDTVHVLSYDFFLYLHYHTLIGVLSVDIYSIVIRYLAVDIYSIYIGVFVSI